MRILFLVYHGFSEVSGISKKIHYQVKGLRENGHDVRLCYYGFADNGHRCRYVDDIIIQDYGKGKMSGIRQRVSYNCIYDYCIREKIEFVYARCFQNANPWLIRLFKKLKDAGVHAVTEIPTYPYDAEFVGFPFQTRMNLKIDQMFRNKLSAQMDAIVTFSDAKEIFGQRTICISNGVDFDSIPLHEPLTFNHELHLIGVAEVHYWHGYDRLIAGIGEYYKKVRCKKKEGREVFFHIVGGVGPSEMYDSMHAPGFEELMNKYDIKNRIIFHGQLFGNALTDVFNQCQFAIGSLARHRSGITNIKTLKNREYATRGIPFIYSEQDSDFDQQPYVVKAPADESPIDILQLISFIDNFTMQPIDIRKTVAHLSWKRQMQRVIDEVRDN
jgi:glycosyltransferase involved in cell wall biosynthesis